MTFEPPSNNKVRISLFCILDRLCVFYYMLTFYVCKIVYNELFYSVNEMIDLTDSSISFFTIETEQQLLLCAMKIRVIISTYIFIENKRRYVFID